MLTTGIPSMTDYQMLLQSDSFREMESFSSTFLNNHKNPLAPYARKWVADPLHQWSRQWEYPFVFDQVNRWTTQQGIKQAKVLDAGSGVTFFSYYLSKILGCQMQCVDQDESLHEIYHSINRSQQGTDVTFQSGDISALPFDDNTFQVVYCISVLEHTENYPAIIREFRRVLADDGMLIVTFDISVDGERDIPIDEAENLLDELHRSFPGSSSEPAMLASVAESEDALTTREIEKIDPRLLPWRRSLRSTLASLRRGKLPSCEIPNLTFYCGTYKP